jgi:MFS family permease
MGLDLTTGLVVSLIYTLCSPGLIAGKTADRFGRNRAIGIACWIFLVGSASMTFAVDFWSLLVGRVITVRFRFLRF